MRFSDSFLGQAMSDGKEPSATRLIAVCTFTCSVGLPALVWFVFALAALFGPAPRNLPEFPGSVIGFMGAAGGLAGGLFAVNKRAEAGQPEAAQPPAPAPTPTT